MGFIFTFACKSSIMGLINLSNEQIIDRLKQENSWWSAGQIDEDYEQMHRRLYFDSFFQLAEDIQIKRAVNFDGSKTGR